VREYGVDVSAAPGGYPIAGEALRIVHGGLSTTDGGAHDLDGSSPRRADQHGRVAQNDGRGGRSAQAERAADGGEGRDKPRRGVP
jgi:hypothetical protein